MILADYLVSQRQTLSDFAALLGVKVSTLHAWTTGAREPDLRSVAKIAELTGGSVTADDWVRPQRNMREAKAAARATEPAAA